MAKSSLTGIDLEIAKFYAPLVLGSLKYGENRVCFWFPGTGKTSTLNLILSSKKVLRGYLGKLYKRLVIVPFSGHNSENNTAKEILDNIAIKMDRNQDAQKNIENPTLSIINSCQKVIDQGKETVLIGDEIDNLSEIEYLKLVNNLIRIVLINRARIHTIINIKKKGLYKRVLAKNNSLLSLSNKIEFIPILSGELLKKLMAKIVKIFDNKIPGAKLAKIVKYTGGILILTKELLRNYPNEGELDLKFQECLKDLSDEYISALKSSPIKNAELNSYGVSELGIFQTKRRLFDNNPEKSLRKITNDKELRLLTFFEKHNGKLESKEEVAKVIWEGDTGDIDYSDWAIDQIVSRFRKKMIRAGLDPSILRTVKGRGYKWNL